MSVPMSMGAREVLRRSTVIFSSDVGFQVPSGVNVEPDVRIEIEALAKRMRLPVNEAAHAVLASLLETEGLYPAPELPSVSV